VDFRILGPVELWAEGREIVLKGARQRTLLALLLLRRGDAVSRDRLIEELWGERPPRGAAKALQVAVSRLRRGLGGEGRRLLTAPTGYQLRLEPGELDLERFERLCDDGRRALAAGRPELAATRLRSGIAEWRGPPLADLSLEPLTRAEVARLQALHEAAVEDRIEADLQAGHHGELVAELEQRFARHPQRERTCAQLMLALYRSGRQGDALEVYRTVARTLDAELGLRPGPELERLQQDILVHDPGLRYTGRGVAEAREPERRRATATILFTDLAGSTRMRAELGDDAADAVRREHDRRLRDVLALHAGREIKALGDGLLAIFDAAGKAVECAVDMQRAIDRQTGRGAVALGLRLGIGAGDVAFEGDDVFGTPVVEARRLCDAAAGGEILAADAVRLLTGSRGDVAFEDARDLPLPGIEQPVRAWTVSWTPNRTVSVALAAPLAVEPETPFAGRRRELAVLHAAWLDAGAGRRCGVFVAGEPGIGKTRLAAELAQRVAEEGGLVLYGHCDDGLVAAAQPFAEALSAYAAACPPDELRIQLGARAGDLLRILPELAAYLPGIAEPPSAAPDVERLRTLEATASLLGAAGAAAPVLLVLDDLHWADELSLLLLRHVLRADSGMRLLVLATYRDTEPSRSPLLTEILTGLARRPDVTRMELGPLDEPDVAAILADAGREPAHAARVRAATEGNPFFVVEVVRALDEAGDPAAAITPRVRDVVRWRLARLPDGTTDVLTAAAVVGAEFDADVAAGAAGVDLHHALDALEAAERARLVRPARALDRFIFAHALVRQTILDELAAARRVRLHAHVARALHQKATTRAVAAGDLANHFAAAGTLVDPAEALAYARRAAEEASARLAFDVAVEHYEQALGALERLRHVRPDERVDLELAFGHALRLAGDARAVDVLRRVAADADAAGDGPRMAEALLTLGLGPDVRMLAEDADTVALLRRALTLLPAGDSPTRARLLAALAHEALYSMPDAERLATVDRAIAMARRAGDSTALASVLKTRSWLAIGRGEPQERLALADELIAIGREGPPYAETDGHLFRHIALVELAEPQAADAALADARATARLPVSHWTVAQWTAARALLAGRLADAEAEATRTAALGREAGFPAGVVQTRFTVLLWAIRVLQGRLAELEPIFRVTADAMSARPAWTFVSEAQLAWEAGDAITAQGALERAFTHDLLDHPSGAAWASTLLWAADLCADLEDQARAADLYELLAPRGDAMIVTAGPVARPLGRLARTLGDRDEAERRLRHAMAICERMDARAYLALVRRDLGDLLLPRAEGRRLTQQARTAADELGMVGLASRSRRPR
jgi:DNA-binding SARP family transcriptional activator